MNEEQFVRTLETSIELVTLRKAVKEMRNWLEIEALSIVVGPRSRAHVQCAEMALAELNRLAPPKEEKGRDLFERLVDYKKWLAEREDFWFRAKAHETDPDAALRCMARMGSFHEALVEFRKNVTQETT